MEISIVSPIYKGERMLSELVKRIISSVEIITNDYEIILVNDASPDDSWSKIKQICSENQKVKAVNLSRNFGQHYAITAGLTYAQGNWIIVMDCDLQDRPEEIPNLYKEAQLGYDSVFAQRIDRKDNFIKKSLSKLFYCLFSYLTETPQDPSVGNFGIYSRKVINAVLSMGDSIRFFPTQVQWVGFHKSYLPIKHDSRLEGTSSYNFKRLFGLAFDTIIAFSDKPMRIMMKFGFFITLISIIVSTIYAIEYFCGYIQVLGFSSLILSIWVLGGIIIFLLGVVGLYVGKLFDKAKHRPTFIVEQEVNI